MAPRARKARITAEEAAANGAAFLDKYLPEWEKKIDIRALDLSNPHICMIGQLNGGSFAPKSFCSNLVEESLDLMNDDDKFETTKVDTGLRIPGFTVEETKDIIIKRNVEVQIDENLMGFNYNPNLCEARDTDGDPQSAYFSDLTEAWVREIKKRRSAHTFRLLLCRLVGHRFIEPGMGTFYCGRCRRWIPR